MNGLLRIQAFLQQADNSSANLLTRKSVATQLEVRLRSRTLGLPYGANERKLRLLPTSTLSKTDPLVQCRTNAFIRDRSSSKLSVTALKSKEDQNRLLYMCESLAEMIDISIFPTVTDDSEARINAKNGFGDSAMQNHTFRLEKGILLAVHKQGELREAFIYSSNITSHLQSEDRTLQCDLAKTYKTPDESLSFPLHPGDEVEFSFTQIDQQTDISDITVTCYNKLTDDEIEGYLGRLQDSDSMDALMMITSFPPMWRYIVNVSKLPEGVLQKIMSLHNNIWQSKKSVLQRSRLERLMQSYVGAKFLDLVYNYIDAVATPDTSTQAFFTGFIKYLPTSSFAVVRHIRRLTQVLNETGQMATSYNFLMEIVTATCLPPKTANASALPWDQTPLIITPDELRVLTQAGSQEFAELPVVQTNKPYEDLTNYYDTYFRLLREDCFGEVCSVIRSARLGQLDEERNVAYKVNGFTGLHFLMNGRGMSYGIKFEPSSPVDWTTSDALKCENLVCISVDGNFEDSKMIWATIATQRGSKQDKLNKVSCMDTSLLYCLSLTRTFPVG